MDPISQHQEEHMQQENTEAASSDTEPPGENNLQHEIAEPSPDIQPNNMEVHHHPDLHHEKKNLKEYFLEFLMIFLAVTMGFIAENIREHITDRAKEKEYIESFISNIESDTSQLREVIEFDKYQLKGIDSFLLLSNKSMADAANTKMFYAIPVDYFFSSFTFKSNDVTLLQLKNSGGYRLIQKDHVADSLTIYDARVNNIYNQGSYYIDYYKEIRARLDELIDLSVYRDTLFYKNSAFTDKKLPALPQDPQKLRLLFNKVYEFRIATYSYSKNYLQSQLQYAGQLIAFLRKEYGIEE